MGRASWLGLVLVVAVGAALSSLLFQARPEPATDVAANPRVILFAPNLTETAFELGAGDRVLAVTDYCVWPAAARERPRIGGMIDPNLERIAALSPQLLVLQGENADLRSFAAEHGLTVASVKMDDDLSSILAGFAQLDSLLNADAPRASRGLTRRVRAQLDGVRRAAGPSAPTVLLVMGREPGRLEGLYTVGGGSFLSELVEVAGGRNIYAQTRRGYFLLSLETLLADPPDLVLEIRAGQSLTAADREAIVAPWRRPGLQDVRVEVITFDGAMIPGPRIGETARHFARAVAGTSP